MQRMEEDEVEDDDEAEVDEVEDGEEVPVDEAPAEAIAGKGEFLGKCVCVRGCELTAA